MIDLKINKRINEKLKEKRFLIYKDEGQKEIFDFNTTVKYEKEKFLDCLADKLTQIELIQRMLEESDSFWIQSKLYFLKIYGTKKIEDYSSYDYEKEKNYFFNDCKYAIIPECCEKKDIFEIFAKVVRVYVLNGYEENSYDGYYFLSKKIMENMFDNFIKNLSFLFIKKHLNNKVEEPTFDNFRYLYDDEKLSYNKNRILVYALTNSYKKMYIVYNVNDDDFELLTFQNQISKIREEKERQKIEEERRREQDIALAEYREEKLKKLEDIKNAINRPRTGYYCRTGFLGNKIIENFKI